jgi:hypothetical protein
MDSWVTTVVQGMMRRIVTTRIRESQWDVNSMYTYYDDGFIQ